MKTIINNPRIGLAAGLLIFVLFSSIGFAADAPASGTFTTAQFESGEALYQQRCSLCHGAELDSAAAPMVAGVTTTAGGLVISGELTGNLLIMDASSGDVLHSVNTGAPVGGGIVTYEVEGRQYIATNSGNAMMTFRTGNEVPRTGSIIVYALPED